jgi:hypothetical protein
MPYSSIWPNVNSLSLCRFQILREILPQNDQKRDKASFLLEVGQCDISISNKDMTEHDQFFV